MFFRIIVLATLLFPSNAIATVVRYVDMSVMDDDAAQGKTPPRPLSVSDIITDMQREDGPLSTPEGIEELDLGENYITCKGAIQILKFASELSTLKKLSFFNNQISESNNVKENREFELSLLNLLKKRTFKKIDLRMNSIANSPWIEKIKLKAGKKIKKIKWKNTHN